MYWNDRVFRNFDAEHDYEYFTIQEVYYDENDEIIGYVDANAGKSPWGDSPEELEWVIASMSAAFTKPVIDKAELEAHFEELRNQPQDPEGPYEVYDSVEELLAALEEDDE